MRIFCGGVRGSSTVADPAFAVFGGDTSCLLVEGRAGERIVIDVGSGIREVSRRLLGGRSADRSDAAPEILVLMTHWHLDHVVGLGTFAQLYDAEARLTFAAPTGRAGTVREALTKLIAAPYWPIALPDMAAQVSFVDLLTEPSVHHHGGLEIRCCAVPHPGGCTAYRIDERACGDSFVFATDMEWGTAGDERRGAFLDFCRRPKPAAVLIMDGQYRDHNIESYRGWGHSTLEEAAAVAGEVDAGRLFVTHHDPTLNDERLAAVEEALMRRCTNARLARQGQVIDMEEGNQA